MSLLFNVLYSLVIAFLPREPHEQYGKGKLRDAEILPTPRMGICQTHWPQANCCNNEGLHSGLDGSQVRIGQHQEDRVGDCGP